MPQMSPMLWFSLYMYFLILLFMFIILIHYLITNKLEYSLMSSLNNLERYKIEW